MKKTLLLKIGLQVLTSRAERSNPLRDRWRGVGRHSDLSGTECDSMIQPRLFLLNR